MSHRTCGRTNAPWKKGCRAASQDGNTGRRAIVALTATGLTADVWTGQPWKAWPASTATLIRLHRPEGGQRFPRPTGPAPCYDDAGVAGKDAAVPTAPSGRTAGRSIHRDDHARGDPCDRERGAAGGTGDPHRSQADHRVQGTGGPGPLPPVRRGVPAVVVPTGPEAAIRHVLSLMAKRWLALHEWPGSRRAAEGSRLRCLNRRAAPRRGTAENLGRSPPVPESIPETCLITVTRRAANR